MRVIKYICLFCFLIFGIIMQTEIFQNELWNFESAYFTASRYEVSDEEMAGFIGDVKDVSSEHGVHIFSWHMEIHSNYVFRLNLYGDEEVRKAIKEAANVEERTYTSLISGIADVKYHDFDEVCDLKKGSPGYDQMIAYAGDQGAVDSVYQELSQKYDITEPQIWQSKETDMILIVWGMISVLMVVMNVIEAIRRKKEVVLRASFGESVGSIVLKSALVDAVLDIAVFVMAKLLLSRFVSGYYENRLVLLIFFIGMILSVIPYLSFFAFDIRMAFSNAESQTFSVSLLYVLKLITCAVTVFTLCTNFGSIQSNLIYRGDLLEPYYEANYFTIRSVNYEVEDGFWSVLFGKEYDKIKPVICVNVFSDERDCIFVNHNAQSMLQGLKDEADEALKNGGDILVFIPDSKKFEYDKTMADEAMPFFISESDPANKNLDVRYIKYSGTEMFSYLSNNSQDGVRNTRDPVVIFQANDDSVINEDISVYSTGAIIFDCDEATLRELTAKYDDKLGTTEAIITKVYDQYTYTHSFLVKLISFLSSMCIVVLLLNIAIMVTISRLEFRKNAMRISLMKILGYGIFDRHKALLGLIAIEDIFVLIGAVLMALLWKRVSMKICLIVCAIVMISEFVIIIFNIVRTEQTNVQKALKGGCL